MTTLDTALEPKKQAEIIKKSAPETDTEVKQGRTASGEITVDLFDGQGKYALGWNNPGSTGRWDYVALCANDPGNDPYGYLTNQWQYTGGNNSPYVTGTSYVNNSNYHIIYVTWDYSQGAYRILAKKRQR
ncbi:MAG: hypothetical protein V7L29_35110 [Nostoc sp.]|uniref:hypothetical protein n=1 Tax=Nostoc sp. TaxID=1180 RepID=UPI002FF1620A